ncbi:MAG: hypothetical protein IKM97_04800 [Clostridia bacterium]|nr:hypothetical protein [Clostridia bacterium]
MIECYQELLNECIDIQEHNRIVEVFKKVNEFMRGGDQMLGKHSYEVQKIRKLEEEKQELLAIISRKDKEITDIKKECIKQFEQIRDLCFANEYNGHNNPIAKLRKIEEIASNNFSALVVDIVISESDENKKAKIIELPNTDQSN